jgi:carboxymethylenebutenolidase
METTHGGLSQLNWLQRYLAEEYVEDYQEGALTRRQALKFISAVMGNEAEAKTLLSASEPPAPLVPTPEYTRALANRLVLATTATSETPTPAPVPAGVNVPANDPSLDVRDLTFPGAGLDLVAYLAKPKGDGPFPAILVCHENRGLTDHIKDVARRVAKAGYVALAVDLLSSEGGTDKVSDPAQIPGILSNTPPDELAGYFLSAIDYLQSQPDVKKDQLGMVGFCFGGGMTWLVSTKAPQLKAAVPFYGPNPPLDAVPNIRAAVLAIYGENDQRINAGIPAIEEAMRENGKVFEKVIYPGASHAFHNDTGRNYNPEAAVDAWARTLGWFQKYVKGS